MPKIAIGFINWRFPDRSAYIRRMSKALSKREKIINKVSNMKRPVLLRLAAASGLPVTTLNKVRTGQTSQLPDETFEKIGDALGY